jgi:hypothetical protein
MGGHSGCALLTNGVYEMECRVPLPRDGVHSRVGKSWVCVAELEAEGLIRREKRYGKVLGRT